MYRSFSLHRIASVNVGRKRLDYDATFGSYPLVMKADLMESCETVFQYATFRAKHLLMLMVKVTA